MQRSHRQERLLKELMAADRPLTGSELAERCGVTRQVVVHDIALLRAGGVAVHSTPRGYELQASVAGSVSVLSVCHPAEKTRVELLTLVDFGIRIQDVIVEHPVYGELRGGLHLASRRDVDQFLRQVSESSALLLSSLTDGFHLHTVVTPSDTRLREAVEALRTEGIDVFDFLDPMD